MAMPGPATAGDQRLRARGHLGLAVDAEHSDAHVRDFCRALEGEGLPLPAPTAITHWHWDHAFGMHAVSGHWEPMDMDELVEWVRAQG